MSGRRRPRLAHALSTAIPPGLHLARIGHEVKDLKGRAYNRTTHLDERVRMMQEWADYLNRLRDDNAVHPLAVQAYGSARRDRADQILPPDGQWQ